LHSTFIGSAEVNPDGNVRFLGQKYLINLHYFTWVLENPRHFMVQWQNHAVDKRNQNFVTYGMLALL